ncbi:uncharacterized protein DEA37_0005037 [Paragonimus westermani]|uniref:PDZ domain-containing protein n=1 Tax=Paragonimus westermani TaxID=34504 RepID=A0A5J4P0A5_9TREM|nr:uncharacterized protein DEA37_0005037 [Paragonimus westermani]
MDPLDSGSQEVMCKCNVRLSFQVWVYADDQKPVYNSTSVLLGKTTTTAHASGCFTGQPNDKLEPGDELIEVNHVNVESHKDHQSIMQELNLVPVGQSVQFTLARGNLLFANSTCTA